MAKLIVPEAKMALIAPRMNKSVVNKDSIEAMTAETDKKVWGTFINVECPGQPAKVSGKYYKGMQYFSKVFQDGERAEIPLSVARFINERCQASKHENLQDERGNPIKQDKYYPRYKFMIEGGY